MLSQNSKRDVFTGKGGQREREREREKERERVQNHDNAFHGR